MRQHRTENCVYIGLWLIVAIIFVLDNVRARVTANLPLFDMRMLTGPLETGIPVLLLFAVNNFVFIPRYLLKFRYRRYVLCVIPLLVIVGIYQYVLFAERLHSLPTMPPMHGRHLIPLPLLFDCSYDILVIGVNCAIALTFQSYYDKLERERMQKINAESQLTYLKAQINPHFYMNMLNNIHGMIELDAERAQTMILDMSRLMRYLLYESSSPMIPLRKEIEFLTDYVNLMRSRYPEDRVQISTSFPPADRLPAFEVPPLIFLVFVENAFKHGISFKEQSFIAVEITVHDNQLTFKCMNSRHDSHDPTRPHGVGLSNVRQRLELIYGPDTDLTITEADKHYSITLNLPAHEPAHHSH